MMSRIVIHFLTQLNQNTSKVYEIFYIALCSVVFMLLASYKLSFPGIHYDEVLFTNAALGVIDGTFITYSIAKIPILLMPYIGALKAYMYYPIFSLFEVSYESIRFPSIALVCVANIYLYLSVRKLTSQLLASIVLLFLSCDASMIAHARLDIGPTTIELLLKSSIFYCYITWICDKKERYLWICSILFLLGVFNKLNFIWFVNASLILSAIMHRHMIVAYFQSLSFGKKSMLVVTVLLPYIYFSVVYIYFKIYLIQYSDSSFLEHVRHQVLLFEKVVDGTGLYQWVFRKPIEPIFNILSYMLAATIGGLALAGNSKTVKSLMVMCFILTGIIGIQLIVTRSATAPWHSMSMYPFPIIIFAASIWLIIQKLTQSKSFLSYLFAGVLVLLIPISSLGTYLYYTNAYDKPMTHPYWSKQIDQVAQYVNKHQGPIVSVDWGIHTQLLTFTQKSNLHDHWAILSSPMAPDQENDYIEKILDPKNNTLFIAHSAKQASFPKSYNNIQLLAEKYDYRLVSIQTFYEGNDVAFEVYKTIKSSH